jgi:hypothetical protein
MRGGGGSVDLRLRRLVGEGVSAQREKRRGARQLTSTVNVAVLLLVLAGFPRVVVQGVSRGKHDERALK